MLDMPVDPNEPTYCLCHQVCCYDLLSLHSLGKRTDTIIVSHVYEIIDNYCYQVRITG